MNGAAPYSCLTEAAALYTVCIMPSRWNVNRRSLFIFSVINLQLHVEELIISVAVFGLLSAIWLLFSLLIGYLLIC